MSLFSRKDRDSDRSPKLFPVPEDSTVLGTDGNYTDPRVMIRNLAYDALLGELADDILFESFGIPPVSEEGHLALSRDSEKRLSKVMSAMPIIDSAVDTVMRIVSEAGFKNSDIPEEMKERIVTQQMDICRRCALSAISALVDLGLLDSHLPLAKVSLHEEDDDE